jgi:hypothetical protein
LAPESVLASAPPRQPLNSTNRLPRTPQAPPSWPTRPPASGILVGPRAHHQQSGGPA